MRNSALYAPSKCERTSALTLPFATLKKSQLSKRINEEPTLTPPFLPNHCFRSIWLSHPAQSHRRTQRKEGLCLPRIKSTPATLWLQNVHALRGAVSGTICLLTHVTGEATSINTRTSSVSLLWVRWVFQKPWILNFYWFLTDSGLHVYNLSLIGLCGHWGRGGSLMWFLWIKQTF